ncbi:kinase-like protein [Rhizophagus irregularis]|uniref:Kinase-like protein n=1 Tax=Rhizophagus irregularis TaxID=588596 RepID=A0A2N0PGN4_9GLOM|nr:kinase-like protein [Rhizophagus irregularis]
MFIPFNNDEDECYYCKRSYSATLLFKQKYCKHCLILFVKYTASNNLDVHITTIDNQCSNRHRSRSLDFCIQNIHEWCNSCSEILCFKQIVTNNRFYEINNNKDKYRQQKLIENEKDCKLCGKILYKQMSVNIIEFKLCLYCYKISSGWIESTLTKEVISILYLPWWDAYNQCIACDQFLKFKYNYQKFCSNCKIIYVGCKYCLTTNIIFGITDQSQCKGCKRIEEVSITINTKDDIDTCRDINDVLYYIQSTVALDSFNCKIANYLDTIKENSNILYVYDYVRKIFLDSRTNQLSINEIPHTQITNFKYVTKGGFGIIYKATWLGQDVAVKRFLNSQNISKYFLNEVKSLFQCYSLEYIIEVYGILQDIESKDYMLVMKYASGGNLHNHLQKNFSNIAWKKKLYTLWKISEGLNATWLGQDVAVKRFLNSQNISKYFLNEVKALFQCYSLEYIIEVYGITQDIETKDFMLVMKYASGGDLHNHLQKNFSDIAWKKKLHTLWKISECGNILLAHQTWLICDLGLSLPANYSLLNNEVYGVTPYIAPEIFKGGAFSKESDVYSIGMIMWELTTGCKPFAHIDHDVDLIYKIIDGKQPEITKDTPECFANLMKRCWDSNPSKRPLITEIIEGFNNCHMISNLSSMRSFSIKQDNILIEDNEEYNSKEKDLDIEISNKSKKRNITKILQIETPDQEKRIKIVNKN